MSLSTLRVSTPWNQSLSKYNEKTKYKTFYRQFMKTAMNKLNGVLILDLNPNVLPHFSK